MSRKVDLEDAIRESYKIIRGYEDVARTSNRPEEQIRARKQIEDQKIHLRRYISEYLRILGASDGILEIAGLLQEVPSRIEYATMGSSGIPYPGPGKKLFPCLCSDLLQLVQRPNAQRVDVRIYAPVGLWYINKQKDEWLRTLARLADDEKIFLRAVFGLPPAAQGLRAVLLAIQRLMLFGDKHGVKINYFPPPREEERDSILPGTSLTAAPGLGMVAFNKDTVIQGYYLDFETTVSQGLRYEGHNASIMLRWFDNMIHKHCFKLIANPDRPSEIPDYRPELRRLIRRYYPSVSQRLDSKVRGAYQPQPRI
jgi:hypothetical protein